MSDNNITLVEDEETKSEMIYPINIEDKMRESFIPYAYYVISNRALSKASDGLKPVQRRILYEMSQMGLTHNAPRKKSAAVAGSVIAKWHPHGRCF